MTALQTSQGSYLSLCQSRNASLERSVALTPLEYTWEQLYIVPYTCILQVCFITGNLTRTCNLLLQWTTVCEFIHESSYWIWWISFPFVFNEVNQQTGEIYLTRNRLPYSHICSEAVKFLKLPPYFCINDLLPFLVTVCRSLHRILKSKFNVSVMAVTKAECISGLCAPLRKQ